MKKNIDELLEDISVLEGGLWENELTGSIINNWYAVANDDGIIAYFGRKSDAFMFRLDYINRILNE